MAERSDEYEAGRRDGKLSSLEKAVAELTDDVKTLRHDHDAELKTLKAALWALYGAIALVQFLPDVLELVKHGRP